MRVRFAELYVELHCKRISKFASTSVREQRVLGITALAIHNGDADDGGVD